MKVRGDVRRRREIILALLKQRPRSWRELKEATGFTEPTLWRHLSELERAGVVMKGDDGLWYLGSGYAVLTFRNVINEFFERFEPAYANEYSIILLDPELHPLLRYRIRKAFVYLFEEFVSLAYNLYATFLMEELEPDERRKLLEAFVNLTMLGCIKLEEKVERLKKIDDEGVLSFYFLAGFRTLKGKPDAFLLALDRLGVIGVFVKEALNRQSKRLPTKGSTIERKARESLKILELFFEKLSNMKLLATACLDKRLYSKQVGLLSRFERWLRRLRDGELDYRSHLLNRGKLLLRFAREIRNGSISKDLLRRKIDPYEPWTLEDIYWYHSRGKEPSFYEEIYLEIEKMRERLKKKPRIEARDQRIPDWVEKDWREILEDLRRKFRKH